MQNKTQRLVWMSICVALTAIGSFVRIPIPGLAMVFTAQVYMVLLTGLVLGAKDGMLAMFVYIAIGLCGFPVFSKGGGLHTLATPEGGYLIGFVAAAGLCGLLRAKSLPRLMIAALSGVLVMHAVALCVIAAQFAIMGAPMGTVALLQTYSLAFLPVDLFKGVGAALTARALFQAWKPIAAGV